jgi:hypothetical protein
VFVIPSPYNVCVVPDLIDTMLCHKPSSKVKKIPYGVAGSITPPPHEFAMLFCLPIQKPSENDLSINLSYALILLSFLNQTEHVKSFDLIYKLYL